MVKYFDLDEWYPVFTLRDEKYNWDWNDPVELSEAEIADFERVLREFRAWQKRLEALADAAVERRGNVTAKGSRERQT